MKRKNWIVSLVTIAACFSLGWASSPRVLRLLHAGPTIVRAHAQWASPAGTVTEQVLEADVIVRARVEKVFPPRIFQKPLAGSDDRFPPKFDVAAFTESLLRVEEVYRGTIRGTTLRILQTGGVVPETPDHPALQIELEDDPLLVPGTEHVFFLKDISGDRVHAPKRKLYRIVNSAGRYDVSGQTAVSPSKLRGRRPSDLEDLELQIRTAE